MTNCCAVAGKIAMNRNNAVAMRMDISFALLIVAPALSAALSMPATQAGACPCVVRLGSKRGLNGLIERRIPIRERLSLEFRTEMFNATNSVVFNGLQTSITSAAFGTVALTQSNTPRVIQFALRMVF